TSLAFSADRDYNRFLVRLNQSFYTVSFDLPLGLHDLFAPSVTADHLDPYVGPGNPPTYISSVTYGRTFYLLIESTASVDDMRASIKASYSAAVVDAAMEADATYVNELENVNIKVFALGGDQSLAAANFQGSPDALGDYLTQGADLRTGVPLSYVVRNVVDNRIVNVKVATDYDVKTCVPVIVEQLASDFESDDEGWTAYSNKGGAVRHLAEAECLENSGGGACIAQTDVDYNGGMQFRAPLEWRDGRSWQAFYGGRISYYLRLVDGSPPPDPADAVGITIEGPDGSIRAKLPLAVIRQAHDVGWIFVEWNLDESGTTFAHAPDQVMRWTNASGHPATSEEIEAVLQRVTDFRITGEFYWGRDSAYLDRVRIQAAGETGVGVGW
ncbi:MAG: thiol-activated cytolysin family protein, partial [Gemmatimonadota bacterium]